MQLSRSPIFIEFDNSTARWCKTLTCTVTFDGDQFDYCWYADNLNPPEGKKVAIILTTRVDPFYVNILKRFAITAPSVLKQTDSATGAVLQFLDKTEDGLPYIPPSKMKWNLP